MAEEVLEREELIRMGLVEANGERRAQRVSVRADVGASGDPTHGLPDHLRRTFAPPHAGGAPVRYHVLVRADGDLARLPRGAEDRDELGRHRLHDNLAALLLEAHRAALEVDVPLAHLRRGASPWPEIGEYGDGEELLPVLAGGEHPGDLVVGGRTSGFPIRPRMSIVYSASNVIPRYANPRSAAVRLNVTDSQPQRAP
ncbi:MAG TPA: hypothetical protein VD769_09995, partial [Gaiellaceae bacterium]|nr:hypothetical protein [Gaiellaceae bacterium]